MRRSEIIYFKIKIQILYNLNRVSYVIIVTIIIVTVIIVTIIIVTIIIVTIIIVIVQ
jgi:hypothetical protein